MIRPIGSLQQASLTEDRVLYVYRRDRQTFRGTVFMTSACALLAGGFFLGHRLSTFWGWILALVPLFAAAVLANWSLADLLRPTLFEIEADRRARTLTVTMGQAVAKLGFADVVAIEVEEKSGAWNATLLLGNGRRVGLGLAADAARAEGTARTFSELLGVEVRPTAR